MVELLGQRLENEVQTAESKHNAEICYIAAGNLGRIVQNRTMTTDISTSELQVITDYKLYKIIKSWCTTKHKDFFTFYSLSLPPLTYLISKTMSKILKS